MVSSKQLRGQDKREIGGGKSPEGWTCSVFLQVPTEDKDSFAVVCNGELLGKVDVPCPDGIEVLSVSAPCEDDINFETITDLIGGKGR